MIVRMERKERKEKKRRMGLYWKEGTYREEEEYLITPNIIVQNMIGYNWMR